MSGSSFVMDGASGIAVASILPYGDTLHYPGCGCPQEWAPGSRAADLVDLLAQVSF